MTKRISSTAVPSSKVKRLVNLTDVRFPLWNHRVVKKDKGFGIHEVYYKDNGKIEAVTVDSVEAYGETPEELKIELQRMLACCDKKVLDYDRDFPSNPFSSNPISRKPKKKHRGNK